MIELDAIKTELLTFVTPLAEVRDSLDLVNKEERAKELEREMQEPDFWDIPEKANAKTRELKTLKDEIEVCNRLSAQVTDIQDLIEMANEENDESMVPEIQAEFATFKEDFEKIRLATLLSEEYDRNNAILRLNAGAGGTESCDWASMLYRMYTRWAERKG
ncbi:MAG: PCRF domain-containing protein, partial [Lachnospiraceae bacterium]|nr:PCRF domain-containing protein [Lachnospiraceae bacterium]